VHGDIKAVRLVTIIFGSPLLKALFNTQSNVLVSSDGTAMLADFGSSVMKNSTLNFSGRSQNESGMTVRWAVCFLFMWYRTRLITLYQSPEQFEAVVIRNPKSDVYSLGMVSVCGGRLDT
jgi:serine/threonine protein kinase